MKLLCIVAAFWGVRSATYPTTLPIVDLGYERHQAISFNETSRAYNFSNIRFALPPTGNLRFGAPVPIPATNLSSHVDNGSVGRVCPQGLGAWLIPQYMFLQAYLTGEPYNVTELERLRDEGLNSTSTDPRETEDCLFLDVIVGENVLKTGEGKGKGAPVLVWIYGGGYAVGEKTGGGQFNPSGLLARAKEINSEEFVYVALNYRLGALGFGAGPMFEDGNGTPNAGLLDVRVGLEWIKTYISRFGGDPTQVTVIGESAGGGQIQHQLTAYGGTRPVPFARAIPQSPGFIPPFGTGAGDRAAQDELLGRFFEDLGVKSLDEARQMSESEVIRANKLTIARSDWGRFTFGPVVDGSFVPDTVGRLLADGRWDTEVELIVSRNADEGLLFAPPYITTETALQDWLKSFVPSASDEVLKFITGTLYPPLFDGSQGYTNELGRVSDIIADSVFVCNAWYLRDAAVRAGGQNQTFAYQFAVPPALHGEDIPYTFADENGGGEGIKDQGIAKLMQSYIVSFAAEGRPRGEVTFPPYGTGSEDLILAGIGNVTITRDELRGRKCRWWQEGRYV